jgi:hypothetical protein
MGTKTCRRCDEVKPISEFYVHKMMLDGHLNICKTCVKSRVKKHREENDSVREYDRWRYHNNKVRREKARVNSDKWNAKNPNGYKAHYLVHNAIRDGRLKRMPCQICGSPKSHAHHEDYSKPFEVVWLCASHHQRYHHGKK